jgi:integrase
MDINFTKKSIDNIPFAKKGIREHYTDTGNRYLRIRVSSKKKVFYYYRSHKGKPYRVTIGEYPIINQYQARERCNKITSNLITGKANVDNSKIIFSELFDKYINLYAKVQTKQYKESIRYFEKYLLPIHTKRASNITKHSILELQNRFAQQNGKHTSNRILQLIRAVYNWGIKNEYITCDNPVTNVKLYKERSRERNLNYSEVKLFLETLESSMIEQKIKDFFKVLLFTGQRKSNVLSMKWNDIDFEKNIWIIPGELTKNGDAMQVVLVDEVIYILKERLQYSIESDYVFPGRFKGSHLSDPKTSWKNFKDEAGLKDLRLHDLRRTLGSWQANQGTSLSIIGDSLGHKSLEATQVYSRLNKAAVRSSVSAAVNSMLETTKTNTDIEYSNFIKKLNSIKCSSIQEHIEALEEILNKHKKGKIELNY